MKTCTQCKQAKPLSEFHKRKASPDGLQPICKECKRQNDKEYYRNNSERIKQRIAKYRSKHIEECRAAYADWYQRNKEAVKARSRAWHHANKEKAAAYHKEYYRNNKSRLDALSAERQQNNPIQQREYNHRSRARKYGGKIAPVDFDFIYQRDRGICQICGKPVRYKQACLDHIIPIRKGGDHTPENVQLAHRSCNIKRRII